MRISSKEFRAHIKDVLDAADKGEEIIIIYRGAPRAKLIRFVKKKV